MESAITPHSVTLKIFMKVFDSLVKLILLYSMEIWGGFCHKMKPIDYIIQKLLMNVVPLKMYTFRLVNKL